MYEEEVSVPGLPKQSWTLKKSWLLKRTSIHQPHIRFKWRGKALAAVTGTQNHVGGGPQVHLITTEYGGDGGGKTIQMWWWWENNKAEVRVTY